jgi:hypothetical protein
LIQDYYTGGNLNFIYIALIAISVLNQYDERVSVITATRRRLVFVYLTVYNIAVHAVFKKKQISMGWHVLIKYEIFSNT